MFLKALEIQGFKSFPDKTKLCFGGGITAVVGPNGSGKSNISDAVRWVLGEQSTKSLRSGKMEDVVFGGTAKRRALGFAEVTLIIDNTDRALEFDQDEIAITRRYYRSGESEYKINRATVRLRDVHELFMDTGLGRDGYSMIGQGKIDDIVGSKSTERRDIFEEAAGISRYRYRKIETERKLAHAEDNLVRLRDILSELEGRVEPLRQQSEKAEQFIQFSNEKRELEIGVWLHHLDQSKENLREQDYKITLSNSQYEDLETAISELEKEMEAAEEGNQKAAVMIDQTRREAYAYEEQAAKSEADIAVQKNSIAHNRETIARIERDIALYESGGEEIGKEISRKEEAIHRLETYISERRETLETSVKRLEQLISEDASFSSQRETLLERIGRLSEALSEEKVKGVTAESSLHEITARRLTVSETLHTVKEQIADLNAEQDALREDTAKLAQRITESTNALKGYRLRYDSRQKKCRDAKEQIDQMLLDVKEKKRRAQLLEDLERNLEGFAASVKAVMGEAKQGRLTGIHGPLSRLIKVQPEYATAVEIALGANMQNIVVATQSDAKRAIQFLKERRAGRGTFLPLSSIKGRSMREEGLAEKEGYVGIAADLVECLEEYREIVRFAIGKVVIAENLDCAAVIAKQYGYRFRIVTLDGQVVNAGGSMTGGSLAKGAGLLGRAAEIERIRRSAFALERKAEEKDKEYKVLLQELARSEAEIQNASAELTVAQEDSIRVEAETRRVSEHLTTANAQLDALKKENQTISERSQLLTSTSEEASKRISELEEQSKALDQELEALVGSRDALTGQRESILESNAEIRLEISGAAKDIENARSLISEMDARRQNQSARIEDLRCEAASMKERIDLSNAEILNLMESAEKHRETSAKKAAEAEALAAQKMAGEQKITSLRGLSREKTAVREQAALELARLQERRETMLKNQDELIKKLYDEYELTRNEAEALGVEIDDVQAASKRVLELRSRIRRLGNVNVAAIEEYKEVFERYTFLNAQIQDVETSRAELGRLISDLTAKMREMFTERFTLINQHFSDTFVDLFGGGTAELKLTNPEDVLESGIEIIVQPPGKNISIIEQLSGGEKALIAISIYFAIMKVNPPPFCMLDEVEAALDDVNVVRFAEYLRRMSGKTQFIVITHRRGTMEEADMLYGVTMQEKGVSKLLELNVAQVTEENLLASG